MGKQRENHMREKPYFAWFCYSIMSKPKTDEKIFIEVHLSILKACFMVTMTFD